MRPSMPGVLRGELELSGYTRGGAYFSPAGMPRGGYTLGGDTQKLRLGNEGESPALQQPEPHVQIDELRVRVHSLWRHRTARHNRNLRVTAGTVDDVEITKDIAWERGYTVDLEGFQAAMAEDFSWERSAGHYEAAYAQAIANKKRLG